MSRLIRRKFLNQVSKKNPLDTHFQGDPVSLIKEKERILGTKVARREYHLSVEGKETIIATVVRKSQTKESRGILKVTEKLICP